MSQEQFGAGKSQERKRDASPMSAEDLEALSETLVAFDKGKERALSVDTLTGLKSRGAFMSRAESVLQNLYAGRTHGRRQGSGTIDAVSFIAIDVDHFKSVNDTLGHGMGDVVLKEIAKKLASSVRSSSDLVSRVGGEEMAILFAGPKELALQKAEEIRAAVEAMSLDEMQGKSVTASFGVAEVGADEQPSLDEMLKRADVALYQAKEAGRNRVVEYDSQ